MQTLLELSRNEPLIAPLVFDPISALLASREGFKALYLGGGALGYIKAVTEASLSLTEMTQAALDIRAVCDRPLILDAACGWGDPVHMRRTIRLAQSAGFAGIEIEDQVFPKRVHHHVGQDEVISCERMVAKVEAAVAARTNPDFTIIARTNAARAIDLKEAIRRAREYRRAGADMVMVIHREPEEVRIIGEQLGGPLMFISHPGGLSGMPLSAAEMHSLGYRVIVDPSSPLNAAFDALRSCYRRLAGGQPHLAQGGADASREIQADIHALIDLNSMLDIESKYA